MSDEASSGAVIMRRGVYAGSFDPITKGHVWVIEQGAGLFDELVVAVGHNPEKSSTFTVEEREAFLREVSQEWPNVRVTSFSHRFLIHFAQDQGANYLLRGLRNPIDFENEQVMRIVNADLDPEIATVFVMPPRKYAELSSSFVKGLVGPEGWEKVVKPYVPKCVYQGFRRKLPKKRKK
jgi:pantetheine-phosphate adenylyltransferase